MAYKGEGVLGVNISAGACSRDRGWLSVGTWAFLPIVGEGSLVENNIRYLFAINGIALKIFEARLKLVGIRRK